MNWKAGLLAICLPLCVQAAPDEARYAAFNLDQLKRVVMPGYARWSASATQLQSRIRAHCRGEPQVEAVREAFLSSLDAWMQVEHIRLGPAQYRLRHARILAWPDKHGTNGRQLRQWLNQAQPDLLAPEVFQQQSVAIQGFPTLERLLWKGTEKKDLEAKTYACDLAQTVGDNLRRMGEGIVEEWSGGSTDFKAVIETAAEGNDFFESARELAAELLAEWHTQLLWLSEQKLAIPLGKSEAQSRGKKADSWRSGRALANIHASLVALQWAFGDADIEGSMAAMLDEEGHGDLLDQWQQQMLAAQKSLSALSLPLAQAVSDPQARLQVEQLRQQIRELSELIAKDISPALDLPLGFNGLDGD